MCSNTFTINQFSNPEGVDRQNLEKFFMKILQLQRAGDCYVDHNLRL